MAAEYVFIDEMLTHAGAYGPYQWMTTTSNTISDVHHANISNPKAALNPTWKCVSNSTACLSNHTFSGDDTKRCEMNRKDWQYTEPKEFSVTTQFDLVCDDSFTIVLL